MFVHTRAIVLSNIKYKESSIILKLFTESLGVKSYLVHSVRNAGSKSRTSLFQPLTLLEIVAYEQPGKDLQRLAEYRLYRPFQTVPYQSRKSAIALFITEVLSLALQEAHPESSFFDWLFQSLQEFDALQEGFENYHLHTLCILAEHLGIGIGHSGEFDTFSAFWEPLTIQGSWAGIGPSTTLERQLLLRSLIVHFKNHEVLRYPLRSLQVLKEVFHD